MDDTTSPLTRPVARDGSAPSRRRLLIQSTQQAVGGTRRLPRGATVPGAGSRRSCTSRSPIRRGGLLQQASAPTDRSTAKTRRSVVRRSGHDPLAPTNLHDESTPASMLTVVGIAHAPREAGAVHGLSKGVVAVRLPSAVDPRTAPSAPAPKGVSAHAGSQQLARGRPIVRTDPVLASASMICGHSDRSRTEQSP